MPNAKVLSQKQQTVIDLAEQMKNAVVGVLVDYRGLTVEEDTQLRNKLREAGIEYKVVKNTLTRFAANQIGFEELDPVLNGPTSMAISNDDPIAPAKILYDFAKTNDALEIKAGFMEGKVISLEEITRLAVTPSKETLYAKIMGSLNAPVSSLVRVLQAIVDKGETAETPAPVEEAPAEAPVEAAPVEEAAAEAPAEEAVETAPVEEKTEAPAEEAAAENKED